MPTNGQLSLERTIPALTLLPRPLYARAESLNAGSWTSSHRHDWVQFSYAISGVLGVQLLELAHEGGELAFDGREPCLEVRELLLEVLDGIRVSHLWSP